MSARFGLRLRRRAHRFRGSTWAKFRSQLLELAASFRRAPGSQAVIRARRWSKTKPVEPNKRPRRRVALKPAKVDQLARLKAIVAGIQKQATKKPRIPKKIRRAIACLEAGVPNTGRQWRKLRKQQRQRVYA